MMKTKEEVLKEEQAKVAVANNLGTSLVTGHKLSYFNQASLSAMESYARIREDEAVKAFILWYRKWRLTCPHMDIMKGSPYDLIKDFKAEHEPQP